MRSSLLRPTPWKGSMGAMRTTKAQKFGTAAVCLMAVWMLWMMKIDTFPGSLHAAIYTVHTPPRAGWASM